MNKQKVFICVALSFVFSVIIGLLIYSHFLYPSIVPMLKNGQTILFGDWSAIMTAIECHNLGYDVYLENQCDYWGRKMVYGSILLYLPYVEKFPTFYYLILPLSINFIFLFIVISFFDYKNKIEYLKIALLVLNFPIFLAFERANFDVLIFIFFFLLSISNKFVINHIIICLSSLIKFYPIASISVFLFDKQINRSFFNIFLSISIISIILFFQKDDLIKIFHLKGQYTGAGIIAFSLNTALVNLFQFLSQQEFHYVIPNFFTNIAPANITPESFFRVINLGLNNVYLYYFMYSVLLFLIITTVYKNYRRIKHINKYNYYKDFSMNNYQDRMFIVCSITIISCYLVFNNIVYREIFFIGLVPFIIKQIKENINKEYFNFFLNFILAKLFLQTIITVIFVEKIFLDYSVIFLLSKHFLDFALITIVLINLLGIFYSFYIKRIV